MTEEVRRLLPWVQAFWGTTAAAALPKRLELLLIAALACLFALGIWALIPAVPFSGLPAEGVPALPVWLQLTLFAAGLLLSWPLTNKGSRKASAKGDTQDATAHSMAAAAQGTALPQGAQSLLAILARALGNAEVALFVRENGRLICRSQHPHVFGAQTLGPKLLAALKKSKKPHGAMAYHVQGALRESQTTVIAIFLKPDSEGTTKQASGQHFWAVLLVQRQHGHLSDADCALSVSVAEQIAVSLQLEQALRLAQADKLRLEHMATTDALTELANRRHFMRIFDLQLARAKRYHRRLSLIFLDIDHFKEVNDTFGHAQGDEVLRKVAQALRTTARKTDTVARYGGEEFAILMEETDAKGAQRIAERIQEALAKQPFGAPDAAFYKTVSVGVACFPEHGDDPHGLIACADEALYQAKRCGRNQITLYQGPKTPPESEPQ